MSAMLICWLLLISRVFADFHDFLVEQVRTIPEEKIFYHWGSADSLHSLCRTQWSGEVFKKSKFYPRTGRGLYLAEKPHSSAFFANFRISGSSIVKVRQPMIVEVVVAAGTPYLDLSTPKAKAVWKKAGYTVEEVLINDPKVLIKYETFVETGHDWWVAKSGQGLTVRPLTGHGLRVVNWARELRRIKWERVRKVLRTELRKGRLDDLREGVVASNSRNLWRYRRMGYQGYIGFSKDYDKKVRNTIFFPYYNWRNKLRYISVKSDLDGVCRLYGHRAYLSHEEKQLRFWNDGYAAVIAKDGVAVSVKRGSEKVISSIECYAHVYKL